MKSNEEIAREIIDECGGINAELDGCKAIELAVTAALNAKDAKLKIAIDHLKDIKNHSCSICDECQSCHAHHALQEMGEL